jgi:5'-nucleotidase
LLNEERNIVKTYKWILFDADETLFHFDAFSGLQRMFSRFGIEFTNEDYQEYQILNKSLWIDYQNGIITALQLQHDRFNAWANKLSISPHDLNNSFLSTMAELCMPVDGAINLLNSLKGKIKLGIITNGFIQLQRTRLERTGLHEHFDLLVISEEVGVAKPHPQIFEHALLKMGNPHPKEVLMVGDTLESDILGGINAGFDTCWFNVKNISAPKNIKPHYQISSLSQLESLLLDSINF